MSATKNHKSAAYSLGSMYPFICMTVWPHDLARSCHDSGIRMGNSTETYVNVHVCVTETRRTVAWRILLSASSGYLIFQIYINIWSAIFYIPFLSESNPVLNFFIKIIYFFYFTVLKTQYLFDSIFKTSSDAHTAAIN